MLNFFKTKLPTSRYKNYPHYLCFQNTLFRKIVRKFSSTFRKKYELTLKEELFKIKKLAIRLKSFLKQQHLTDLTGTNNKTVDLLHSQLMVRFRGLKQKENNFKKTLSSFFLKQLTSFVNTTRSNLHFNKLIKDIKSVNHSPASKYLKQSRKNKQFFGKKHTQLFKKLNRNLVFTNKQVNKRFSYSL